MTELINLFITAVFCFFVGFVFGKEKNSEKIEGKEDFFEKEEEQGPMKLRNGFEVTRDKNPTFAEQWVNIMNYRGESQTEENYEENERNYTEGYLE